MTKGNHLLLVQLREQFLKTQARLQKAIDTGRFDKWSLQKKQALYQRILRYAQRLKAVVKPGIVTAMLAAGIVISNTSQAQIVTARTGAANPLGSYTIGAASKPAFADLNNDGDADLIAGESYYNSSTFFNSGTPTTPTFASSSQFSTGYAMFYGAPAFIDIDNDGDLDLVFGDDSGRLALFTNTGTASAQVYANYPNNYPSEFSIPPFSGIDVGSRATPVFVDIDNDGDKDLFIGNSAGTLLYYKNTGTLGAPVFTAQTGVNNPFNGVDVGNESAPSFSDLDNDGDQDAIIGESGGTLLYYKNTGTASAAVFTQQTGSGNPFNGIDVGNWSSPAFTNLDNDSDKDMIVGRSDGGFSYYEISFSTLPVQWQSFTAKKQMNDVLLNWQTAAEQNAQDFVIQHSTNGQQWQQIGIVAAAGNSNALNNYQFVHGKPVTGNNYYRLLQRDKNGNTAYSTIETVQFTTATAAFTIANNTVTNGLLRVAVTTPTTLRLFTGNGQLLQQYKLTQGNHTLAVGTYAKGIYFINGNGKTERLMIQ
jgi:hypothetical protein